MSNQFFLNIQKHEGVFLQDGMSPKATSDFSDFLQNLTQVQRIYFQDELMSYDFGADPDDRNPAIRFMSEDSEGHSINFALIFTKKGMGEYNKYKRQINEFVIGNREVNLP